VFLQGSEHLLFSLARREILWLTKHLFLQAKIFGTNPFLKHVLNMKATLRGTRGLFISIIFFIFPTIKPERFWDGYLGYLVLIKKTKF